MSDPSWRGSLPPRPRTRRPSSGAPSSMTSPSAARSDRRRSSATTRPSPASMPRWPADGSPSPGTGSAASRSRTAASARARNGGASRSRRPHT